MAEAVQIEPSSEQTVGQQAEALRENEPLTDLLSLIPHKLPISLEQTVPTVQRGLKTQYEILELTAVDANLYFIALGSNIGTVFLYDRTNHKLERLRSEDTTDIVTCVSLHHGLDDLVAVGHASGTIYIFQLPSMMIGHSKQLERFIVSDVHQVSLTCLAWSTNGMRLYSGDKQGCVGCAEVNFYEGECKSCVLLIEPNTEIVQLHHGHKALLVSTKHRCIVYRTDEQHELVQVGSKDRKQPGDFGASFIPAMCKPEDAQLYASRPGFRIWKASITGSVVNTFIFKELLAKHQHEIPLLEFKVTNISRSQNPNQFGRLLLFREKELVSWNDCCLYVIDPDNSAVLGIQKHLGLIKDVAVTDSEIFILRDGTDRNLIRISNKPMSTPTSQLLKQLEVERQQKQEQTTNTEKQTDKKTEQSETSKSPFKMFQGNVFEKVKQIANPVTLVDKVQEKLHIDKKKENISGSGRRSSEGRNVSPPGELPPVIQLDANDLLTIEIGQVASETNSPENGSQTLATGCDIPVINVNQSDTKTGTGAVSALARLQEDHQLEENSDPVYRMHSRSDDITNTQPAIDENPEFEDSIVFSRKVKHRKKKKRSREISPMKRNPELRDPDSVSVNSTTSLASDSSGSTQSGKASANENRVFGSEDKVLANEIQVSESEDKVLATENNVIETEDRPMGHVLGNVSTSEQLERSIEESVEESVLRSTTEQVNQPVAMDKDNDIPDGILETCSHAKEEAYETKVSNSHGISSNINVDKETHTKTVTDTDTESKLINHELQGESTSIPGKALHTNVTPFVKDESDKHSNLDREMARLDSYLSETSDVSYLELERSTGQREEQYKSDFQQLAYRTILQRSNSEKEEEILNSLEESDLRYEPSNLEKQLNEFEETALEGDTRKSDEAEGQSLDASSPFSPTSPAGSSIPSIYTMYSKPGASAEDFYSKYSPTSPMSSLTIDNKCDRKENVSLDSGIDKIAETAKFLKSVNTWTEVTAQGNINSMSVSSTHVWITDRSWNIFYSVLTGPGVSWKKASGTASHISVSPDGNIVWSLNKNTVHAGTKITAKRPEGMKWVEAIRDVSHICVDNTSAWYIKTNHQVMMQKGLSRDRPCYTGQEVDCNHRLKQIVCLNGVVWALTENCHWLYRAGITEDCPEGKAWMSGDSGSENRLFSHLCLGEDNIGWAVDILGQVWFCSGVTMETPRGENHWWQVPLSGEYIIKDVTALDMLKSFSKKFDPQQLSVLLSTQSGGLVGARNGIWVCPEYKHVIHICRGSIEGQMWREAHPENLAASSCWKSVVASTAIQSDGGVVWAQQPNGDIFAFSPDRQSCTSIPGPRKKAKSILFVCMSVCPDALWGLTDDGEVHIRVGMSEADPHGSGWSKLDLSQLEDIQLVHISCSNVNVWSVDSDGMVWHRIGVKAPSDLSLNAAWLPVDNGGTVFTQVVSCQQDWKVWAIDNRRQVYVRDGITPEMPIGRKWIHVSGSPAMMITLSDNFVFALNHAGELLCRHGVSPEHVTGDYWKKLPGELIHISASPNNILWGINKEGLLVRRYTKYIVRESQDAMDVSRSSRAPRGLSVGSEDGDWEFV